MIKRFREWLRKLVNKRAFVHPALDKNVNTVIDDKIKRIHVKQERLTEKYNNILNGYLRTYFSKQYASQADMSIAYEATNKEWKSLVRKVNSTEKLINLKKDAFQNQVFAVIEKLKENQNK